MFTSPSATMNIASPASPRWKIMPPALHERVCSVLDNAARSSSARPSNIGIERSSATASMIASPSGRVRGGRTELASLRFRAERGDDRQQHRDDRNERGHGQTVLLVVVFGQRG